MVNWRVKNRRINFIRLNELGRRIGESHPRAVLSDHDVELVLALVEEGLTYAEIAEKFEVSAHCIGKIARGSRRGQAAVRIVAVPMSDPDRG